MPGFLWSMCQVSLGMTNTARPNSHSIFGLADGQTDRLTMDDFVNMQVYWSVVANLELCVRQDNVCIRGVCLQTVRNIYDEIASGSKFKIT